MLFILILGETIQFDEHMFQLGGSVRTAPSIWDCFKPKPNPDFGAGSTGRPACGPIEPIDDSTQGFPQARKARSHEGSAGGISKCKANLVVTGIGVISQMEGVRILLQLGGLQESCRI